MRLVTINDLTILQGFQKIPLQPSKCIEVYMQRIRCFLRCFFLAFATIGSFLSLAQKKTIDEKVDSVIKLMTLDEKVGQMNQYNGDWDATGPITADGDKQNQIRKGMLGSMLNFTGVEHTRQLQ